MGVLIGLWLALAWAESPEAEAVDEVAEPTVWVATTERGSRALRWAVRRAEKLGASVVPVSLDERCIVFDGPPDPRFVERVERRLGHPLQPRLDCAIARFPIGRGWVAAVIEPHTDLERRIADVVAPLSMSVLSQPMDGRPATLCVSGLQVQPDALEADLEAVGLSVRGLYAVGGCEAQAARRAAAGW